MLLESSQFFELGDIISAGQNLRKRPDGFEKGDCQYSSLDKHKGFEKNDSQYSLLNKHKGWVYRGNRNLFSMQLHKLHTVGNLLISFVRICNFNRRRPIKKILQLWKVCALRYGLLDECKTCIDRGTEMFFFQCSSTSCTTLKISR